MMLITLKQYLQEKRLVSMQDLTNHFKLDPEILRQMLALFIRKGHLQKKIKTNQCGVKCAKCHPLITEIYEWLETLSD